MSDGDINLAALWVPVMAETSKIKGQLRKAGEEGREEFLAGARFSELGGQLGEGLLEGFQRLGPVEKLSGMFGGLNLASIGVAAGITGIAVAAEKLVDGLVDVGSEFEEINRSITLMTAMGSPALEGLQEHADNLVASLDTSTKNLGNDMAVLATRLNMGPGQALDTLTRHVEELSDRFGRIDISSLAGGMQRFGLAGEDADDALASFMQTAMRLGVSLPDMVKTLSTSGAVLHDLGLSAEQAGAFIGKLQQLGPAGAGGIEVLQKAMKEASKEGLDLSDFLKKESDFFASDASNAAKDSEAATVFGSKKWEQARDALKKYQETLDEGPGKVKATGDKIDDVIDKTKTLSSEWKKFVNELKVDLKPVADDMIDTLTREMKTLNEWFKPPGERGGFDSPIPHPKRPSQLPAPGEPLGPHPSGPAPSAGAPASGIPGLSSAVPTHPPGTPGANLLPGNAGGAPSIGGVPIPGFHSAQSSFGGVNLSDHSTPMAPAPGPNASQTDVINFIVASAKARGIPDNQIPGILAVAEAESNFGQTGFMGFSTKTTDTGYTGGAPYANDYSTALNKFLDNYMAGGYGTGGGKDAKAAAIDALNRGDPGPFLSWLQNGMQGAAPGLNPEFAGNLSKGYTQFSGSSFGSGAPSVPWSAPPAVAGVDWWSGGRGNTGGSGSGGIPVATGGSAADLFAQSVDGQPYSYGGFGDSGHGGLYDCSGFMSALYGVMTGKSMPGDARFFTTTSDFQALGFIPTDKPVPGTFQIGVSKDHMAGTLPSGANVESGGAADMTQYGGDAAGAWDPQFEDHYYLPNGDDGEGDGGHVSLSDWHRKGDGAGGGRGGPGVPKPPRPRGHGGVDRNHSGSGRGRGSHPVDPNKLDEEEIRRQRALDDAQDRITDTQQRVLDLLEQQRQQNEKLITDSSQLGGLGPVERAKKQAEVDKDNKELATTGRELTRALQEQRRAGEDKRIAEDKSREPLPGTTGGSSSGSGSDRGSDLISQWVKGMGKGIGQIFGIGDIFPAWDGLTKILKGLFGWGAGELSMWGNIMDANGRGGSPLGGGGAAGSGGGGMPGSQAASGLAALGGGGGGLNIAGMKIPSVVNMAYRATHPGGASSVANTPTPVTKLVGYVSGVGANGGDVHNTINVHGTYANPSEIASAIRPIQNAQTGNRSAFGGTPVVTGPGGG